jgi:hypothetical protein
VLPAEWPSLHSAKASSRTSFIISLPQTASLSNDDEYLETEIARVKLLEKISTGRRSSLRIAMLGFPAILYGVLAEDSLIANLGWAVSMISLVFWSGLAIATNVLSQRIPYDLIQTDD